MEPPASLALAGQFNYSKDAKFPPRKKVEAFRNPVNWMMGVSEGSHGRLCRPDGGWIPLRSRGMRRKPSGGSVCFTFGVVFG
ncbi:MAG: hypothetical protein DMG32_25295 [Acidobacteria bacterium]|nr:MAG: hypothetical protein DMG32_25295 [Acidobacteriota bacterium]